MHVGTVVRLHRRLSSHVHAISLAQHALRWHFQSINVAAFALGKEYAVPACT